MCVIVDTNEAHEFFQRSPTSVYAPVIRWISTGNGRLRYGGKLKAELLRIQDAARLLRVWSAAGRAVDEGDEPVAAEEQRLKARGTCRSNDLHVIALARVAGARVLCTRDVDLTADFHNKELIDRPRGKIYSDPSHAHLLRHSSSCGVKTEVGQAGSPGRHRRQRR